MVLLLVFINIQVRLKNLEIMPKLFLIISVGKSSLWVVFEVSKASISLQIFSVVSSIVTLVTATVLNFKIL